MAKRDAYGAVDRGIPTEEVLAQMRAAEPPVHYLVGTPKGRLSRLEQALLDQPWHAARPGVQTDARQSARQQHADRTVRTRSERCR